MNKELELAPLYQLDKKGKIRKFSVEVIGNKVVSKTGILEGKFVTNSKECFPKNIGKANETTSEIQADNEARSIWNDKWDEGYKSIEALYAKYRTYSGSIPGEINEDLITTLLNGIEEKYLTNKDWHPLPMLAQRADKVKDLPKSIYVQRKYNGVRCICRKVGDEIKYISRGGGYYNLPHLNQDLDRIFKQFPTAILDGEIYKHGLPLQIISGTVRKEEGEKSELEYHIYDLAEPGLHQKDRIEALSDIQTYLELMTSYDPTSSRIKFVQSPYLEDSGKEDYEESIKKLHDIFVQEGYEGAILRDIVGNYEPGYRSQGLLKVKIYKEDKFTIISGQVTPGKKIGDSFVFELKNDINDLTFFARPTGTREMKEFWHENLDKCLGKTAVVRYQERTIEGLPHQGHVRSEKSKLPKLKGYDN